MPHVARCRSGSVVVAASPSSAATAAAVPPTVALPPTTWERITIGAQSFALGGLSASVAKTATAPLERVKLVIQTSASNPKVISGEVEPYKGISRTFVRLYHEQGLAKFWLGNGTNVIRYAPTQAINFAAKDVINDAFPRYDKSTETAKFVGVKIVSGGLAGALSLCVVYPLDLARTRLAADVAKAGGEGQFNGLRDCLRKTAAGPEGWRGMYRGFGVSLFGIIPYRAAYFGAFDSLSAANPFARETSLRGVASNFAVAQTSAIMAAYASYPIDTVRRALQMQAELPAEKRKYRDAVHCARTLFKQGGGRAFFEGALANALRTMGSALVLVLYAQGRNLTAKDSRSE